MFDGFTDRARESMGFARKAAQLWKHDYIGTEHLLLGLLDVEGSTALEVLRKIGVDSRIPRLKLAERMTKGLDEITTVQLPFTPRAKRVLEQALEEAGKFGHDYIGTEHLLAGLIQIRDGIAPEVLAELDVTIRQVREWILVVLGADLIPGPPRMLPKEVRRLVEEIGRLKQRVAELERRLNAG